MSNSSLTVVIRTSHHGEDQNITFEKDWTISRLKQEIELLFPGHPKKEKQRLIHAGRELMNEQNVFNVVQKSNNFIHLVYSGLCQYKKLTKVTEKCKEENKEPVNTNQQTSTSVPYRRHVNPAPVYSAYPPHMYGATAANVATNMEMYNAWMMQYQQYMANYMQHYAQSGPQPPSAPSSVTTETEPANDPQINNPQPQNAGPGNAPALLNGGGGFMAAAEEDDVEGGDWLDAAFGLTRLGFLLSIVYYYSTTYRFVITLLVFMVIYLYQIGLFQVNRRPAVNPDAQQNPPQTDDNNNSDINEDDGHNTETINVPPPPSLISTAWCFLRTFITSLIPQNPGVGAN